MSFLKIQWHRLANSLEKKDVANQEIYKQKELTDFCSELFFLAMSDLVLEEFARLLSIKRADMNISHFSVCTDILFGTAIVLLQTLSFYVSSDNDRPFKSLENMTPGEKGKIRYVGGWTLKKLWENSRRYINNNVTSHSPDVHYRVKEEIMKFKIINYLFSNASALQEHSKYKESLEVTAEKQYQSQGLLNISDDCYEFFITVDEQRVNLLTHNRLNSLKGNLASDSLNRIQTNEKTFESWKELCTPFLEILTDKKPHRVELFNSCIDKLYLDLTTHYFKMGMGEYLQSYRRDISWEKTEAHHKKVQMRTQKKELKGDQITMESIRWKNKLAHSFERNVREVCKDLP